MVFTYEGFMRAFGLIVLLFAVAACSTPAPLPSGTPRYSFAKMALSSTPQSANPDVKFVAAYVVTPTIDKVLASVSDLQMTPQPDGTLAVEGVADWGAALTFVLKGAAETGFAETPVTIDPFRSEAGAPFDNKILADAEDMATDPVTGDRYVSFEGIHRIQRFAADKGFGAPGVNLPLKGLPPFPGNEGMEGLAFVRDDAGRPLLLIAVESGGFYACEADGVYQCRAIKGPTVPGFLYKAVSLAALDPAQTGPKRDILVLYRYYDPVTGPRGQLNHLIWDGEALTLKAPLFKLVPPVPIDNYEGVAPVKTATGYRLYLMSDVLKKGAKPHMLVLDWAKK